MPLQLESSSTSQSIGLVPGWILAFWSLQSFPRQSAPFEKNKNPIHPLNQQTKAILLCNRNTLSRTNQKNRGELSFKNETRQEGTNELMAPLEHMSCSDGSFDLMMSEWNWKRS
jgi:hypothetical protein